MTRKIMEKIPDEQLQQDLEKYRQRSVELGATDAKVITIDEVVIDERVLAKCTYPRCFGYGTNANCPPYAMSPDQLRKVLNKFRYAIFIKLEVPADDIAGVEARDRKLLKPFIRKLAEITAKIEAEAFYDGYHLALAFGDGSCKGLFCADVECRALVPGQACPHHLRARAPMEAVGMDAFTMAAKAGWDILPRSAFSKRLRYEKQIKTLNQRMKTTLGSLCIEINKGRRPSIDYHLKSSMLR